jgi:undecaprenol kinase
MSREYSISRSFRFAIDGVKTAIKREPNFRVHLAIAALAIIFAFLLKFTRLEWIILVLTIFLVISTELINTSLESIVNLVSPEIKKEAKIAKDVSAAAVFVTAVLSIVIAFLLYLPKIIF